MKTPTISGKYTGTLRCLLTHTSSGMELTTDAPKDNKGKGEAFSPTDLVAGALGTCMLTIIGIHATTKNIRIGEPSISIIKQMASSPRKIDTIIVEITFNEKISPSDRIFLENEAKKCPVALSLSDSIKQKITFKYT